MHYAPGSPDILAIDIAYATHILRALDGLPYQYSFGERRALVESITRELRGLPNGEAERLKTAITQLHDHITAVCADMAAVPAT